MTATTSALPDSLAATPGAEESCWLQIRNTGEVVDEFAFEVLGDAAAWTELEPPTLRLMPGTEGELKLTFRPPRQSTTPSGVVPLGLRIRSTENPEHPVVEEGSLVIAPFSESGAELVPRTSHGRMAGKHELAFDNRGNVALDGVLAGSDPDDALTFAFSPPTLDAGPGTATFTKLRARPRKRVWRGQPKTHPFSVRVQVPDQQPVTVDGVMVQQAIIPRFTLAALAALAVLAALWWLVLQPNVRSTAREAAKDQQQPVNVRIKQVTGDTAALKAKQAALDGRVDALEHATPTTPAGATALQTSVGDLEKDVAALQKKRPVVDNTITVTTTPKGTPTGARLVVDCGRDCTKSYAVADNDTFSLTDIVLGNPAGDSGTLTLKRDDDILLVESLENFRDLDFHFIAPIVVDGGEKLTLEVECKNGATAGTSEASASSKPCTNAVYVAGYTAKTKPPKQG